ncbi:MAG: flagellar biosynthesis regulator FlaF [Desulfobacteraceae bacterium]|nr:flagellar biosynthesis regulator FlaF [Desulfobacteraceae bacterium]
MTHTEAIKAYCKTQAKTGSPREIEAAAFFRAARSLSEAKRGDSEKYISALKTNRLLWTLIQVSVSGPENQLPPEVKSNILGLSIFIDKQTSLALTEPDPDLLEVLIFIDLELARGLTARPAASAKGAP